MNLFQFLFHVLFLLLLVQVFLEALLLFQKFLVFEQVFLAQSLQILGRELDS